MTSPRPHSRTGVRRIPSADPRRAPLLGLTLGLVLGLGACAGPGPGASFAERDPYEDTNRQIHQFNVALDRNVLRPVAQGYEVVTPGLFRLFVGNILAHIDTANDFANYLLQGELEAAGTALGRFTVNTVVGAGGLLDPATEFGLPREETDFGLTLADYGVAEGVYLVLPFFGPSTTRDLGGRIGDIALTPTTYINPLFDADAVAFVNPGLTATDVVESRAANADLIDDLLYDSDDSYVSLRTVYLQRRDALIRGEDGEAAPLPDIFDDEPTQ